MTQLELENCFAVCSVTLQQQKVYKVLIGGLYLENGELAVLIGSQV